jgi:nickel superoxide dismutase
MEATLMKNFKKIMPLITFAVAGLLLALPQSARSHCEIPCGIYDDHARVQSMLEDAVTVEKSANLIAELVGKTDAQSQNQFVRWVMNKEMHAQKIITTICDYFLTQRVKPDQKDYAERLIKHHAVIVAAVKAKQNADFQYAKTLKESIAALSHYYPEHKQ